MLKETETEETIDFIIKFLSLVTFQFREPGPALGYAYDLGRGIKSKKKICNHGTFQEKIALRNSVLFCYLSHDPNPTTVRQLVNAIAIQAAS